MTDAPDQPPPSSDVAELRDLVGSHCRAWHSASAVEGELVAVYAFAVVICQPGGAYRTRFLGSGLNLTVHPKAGGRAVEFRFLRHPDSPKVSSDV